MNQLMITRSFAVLGLVMAVQALVAPSAQAELSPQADADLGMPSPSVTALEGLPSLERNPMAQVTSVSQLSDVKPTDWAFQALQSLVERYGCIAGYPDKTYRGNRALTRYEFAAGLNACLDRVNELIAAATADLVKKEDLATLQKLQEEFAAELATLRGRVDSLEARTATLEKQQFSTTTKLRGEAIFAAVGGFGGAPNSDDGNITFVNRVRLNLQTSFSGKDLLITGLQAYNFGGSPFGAGSLQEALFPGNAFLTSGMTKLSFEPQFPGFDVKTLSGVGANSLNLYKLLYVFPAPVKNVTLFAGTAAEVTDAFPTILPFYGEGSESISRFGGLNPVLRVSGGTSQTGLASAAGFIWQFNDKIDLRALYGSVNANLPGTAPDILPGVSGTPLGSGVFNGSSIVSAQLTVKPLPGLDIGLNYANSYHKINILGTGLATFSGAALGQVPVGTPVQLNSVGATVAWRITPTITLAGYGAYIFTKAQSSTVTASSNFSSWMAGVHFKDVLSQGSTAGIMFGQPLYRVEASGAAQLTNDPGVIRRTPYHLEAYYRYQLNDNISITPGFFMLFNPEGDDSNDTTTIGVVRTTFTF
jgi:Carbohydrate-selective porin, OprB family/S-layer homology domain